MYFFLILVALWEKLKRQIPIYVALVKKRLLAN